MNTNKIILCGYHWAGCIALKYLIREGYTVYVYTHENPYYVNSLIEYCRKEKIPYSINKIKKENLPFKPDIIASIYYRYYIDKEVINACNRKIFNLHPSLLPEYRGCSSLTWALINGESKVGFSYHYVNEVFDDGNILLQHKVDIEDFDTQQSLYYRVMFKSMDYFLDVLEMVQKLNKGIPQDKSNSKYYKRGCPYKGEIDKTWSDVKTERFIRALINPPLPLATFNGHEIKSYNQYKKLKK